VSDRPSSDPPRSRRAAKRLRHRRNGLARRLLDEAYAQYLDGLASRNSDYSNSNDNNTIETAPLPPPQSPEIQPPSPPRSPTPPDAQPDSPHSILTQRIFPDSPPPSYRSFSPPSYSPVSSPEPPPRPNSPADSTSSVEFVEEIHVPPPRPKYYYHYDPHQPIETLITQFNQHTDPLPSGSYTIGPDQFDLSELKLIIETHDPDSIIPVFLPNSPYPYDVPVRFFYNLFPPLPQ